MSLSTLLLAVFLILFGINAIGWVAISALALGIVAFVTGIVFLVEGYHPITILRKQ
jgi:hypothetical protein